MKKLKVFAIIIIIFITVLPFAIGYYKNKYIEQCMDIKNYENCNSVLANNYNWSFLENDKDVFKYEDENYESVFGIDVSSHQQDIDWNKVKKSGVDFAIIRVGYRGYKKGEINEDKTFESNIKSAIDAGIDVGVYFFSQAISLNEAKEEAQFVLDKIEKYDITYPVVFDMEFLSEEDRIKNISFNDKTNIALAFCNEIEENGYTPMIYGSVSWLQNVVSIDKISRYDLWIANYSNFPNFDYNFKMWQYSSEGYLDGIEGKVDMNIFMKDKDNQIIRLSM